MRVLRKGMTGSDVKKWQYFLIGQGFPVGKADGNFGNNTFDGTVAFQKKHKLEPDGVMGHQTLVNAIQLGFVVLEDASDEEKTGSNWPPKPDFQPLVGTAARQAIFGRFSWKKVGENLDDIVILGNWAKENIVSMEIPQLKGKKGAPGSGRVEFHRLAVEQFKALWKEWEEAGLLDRILTYEGAFVPRLVRGKTSLSNHAFGTAFDINYSWNQLGTQPALVGEKGSVRELVTIANKHGFFWGGHYNGRLDGMHFEIAQVMGT